MNKNQIKKKTTPLAKFYYNHLSDGSLQQLNPHDIDLTGEFFQDIIYRLDDRRLISISISGETASGKSTVGLAIKKFINDMIIEKGYNDRIDEYETICSDQIEANRFVMKGKENLCFLIDEFSELGTSGENATTEANTFTSFVDMMAQKFNHFVACTPRSGNIFDKLCNINLKVIARDKDQGKTFCLISYNDPLYIGTKYPIGIVEINVNDVLKEEWYQKYRNKKFERLALLHKYGVKDIRELEHAEIILEVYEKLKKGVNGLVPYPDHIVPIVIGKILQTKKIFFSLIGKANLEQPLKGLIKALHSIKKMEIRTKSPMPEPQLQVYKDTIKFCTKELNQILEIYKQNKKILEEYLKIQ